MKPYIHADLVDAAAALLLCQHDSPFVESYAQDGAYQFEMEGDLAAAREAASRYLVAAFDAAIAWNEDDAE
jgi:hypothetical protein